MEQPTRALGAHDHRQRHQPGQHRRRDAGVSGATSVTATTGGADIGSITFTGTTYNANAQTYTAPPAINLLLNAGAATTFTSTADAVTFTTGTLLLADGSRPGRQYGGRRDLGRWQAFAARSLGDRDPQCRCHDADRGRHRIGE